MSETGKEMQEQMGIEDSDEFERKLQYIKRRQESRGRHGSEYIEENTLKKRS